MLPLDDGAPEATCAFAVHIIHRKSDGTNTLASIWRLIVLEVAMEDESVGQGKFLSSVMNEKKKRSLMNEKNKRFFAS